MRFVRGRVLDLGCGAGRVGLHLQSRGHEVVGIDVSPLAVEIARKRGLADARLGTLDGTLRAGERFDTILLLGNNLGLLAGERQGRHLLRKLARAATDRGRILAGSYDPYDGASEFARGYHARNRARGRMGGVERIRVRYRQYATPWYDVLFASREEVARLVKEPAGSPAASSTTAQATSPCSTLTQSWAAEHLSVDGRMEMEETQGKEEEPGGWTAPYWYDEFSRQHWRGGSQRRARAVPVQRSVRCRPARSIRRLEAGQGSLHVPAHATSRDRRRRGSRGR
jgi:SAM-dependent methyltransferase